MLVYLLNIFFWISSRTFWRTSCSDRPPLMHNVVVAHAAADVSADDAADVSADGTALVALFGQ